VGGLVSDTYPTTSRCSTIPVTAMLCATVMFFSPPIVFLSPSHPYPSSSYFQESTFNLCIYFILTHTLPLVYLLLHLSFHTQKVRLHWSFTQWHDATPIALPRPPPYCHRHHRKRTALESTATRLPPLRHTVVSHGAERRLTRLSVNPRGIHRLDSQTAQNRCQALV
jgi:hypothetical protein